MTKIKNIPHFIIICLSLLYSAYVVEHYLELKLGFIWAVISAIALTVLSHYYLILAVHEMMKTKRIHGAIILGVPLACLIFFMEWKGVKEVVEERLVNNSKVEALQDQLSSFRANMSKVQGTGWRQLEEKRRLEKQIKEIKEELKKEQELVSLQQEEAKETTQDFRVFSIFLMLFSLVSSTMVDKDEDENNDNNSILALKSLLRILQEKTEKIPSIDKDFSKEIQQETDIDLDKVIPIDDTGLSREGKIDMATKYIKETHNLDTRYLSKKFRICFSDVSLAKKKAGVKKSDNKPKIGFK